jgi:predicted transcriptional regulator
MYKGKAYTTKLDIDLMTEIRELAQVKAKHQNDMIEEAIRDMSKNEIMDAV